MSRSQRALFLSRGGGALAVGLLVCACGSAAVPTEKLTNTRASIRAAEEVGAQQVPRAALHLKLARDQLARADQLMSDGDREEAELVLNQAQADADLAIALSHESRTKQQAQQARARVDELRSQSGVH